MLPTFHPSTHPCANPAGHPPPAAQRQPLRLREASWPGSPACCRGRGPTWWAAAGPARSWWLATCSGCTPGSGWLLAGSGTTGRWCLVDCRVGEGRSGSGRGRGWRRQTWKEEVAISGWRKCCMALPWAKACWPTPGRLEGHATSWTPKASDQRDVMTMN